nr:MAG: rod shape-determining protein MreD [Bacillota bacterium]
MRYWVVAAIVVAAYLVESVLGPFLAIGGAAPNVVFVVGVTLGLLFGWQVGLGAGFAGGLLLDLTVGQLIGSHALAGALVGFVAGLVEERVFKDNLLLPLIGGVVGSVLGQSVVFACLLLFGRHVSLSEFSGRLLPAAAYDTVLCALVYWRVFRLYTFIKPDPRGVIVLRYR